MSESQGFPRLALLYIQTKVLYNVMQSHKAGAEENVIYCNEKVLNSHTLSTQYLIKEAAYRRASSNI